jgi:nitroreductase
MEPSSTSNPGLDLIFGRRSIRVFSPGAVTERQVQTLLEAAMAAPSAMTKDPWRFVVIREAGTLAKLPSMLPGGSMLATAAAAVLVAGDLDAAFEQNAGYLVQDCSAATENLLLAAHALGLGACWVGIYPSEQSSRAVRELLSLPARVLPIAMVALGVPGEQPGPRTRYSATSVYRERWGGRD